jgi:ATP-dependent RNA helicase DeaD
VPGSVVGAIRIDDTFSLVDVQEGVAEAVLQSLRGATIRGRRLRVRRDS